MFILKFIDPMDFNEIVSSNLDFYNTIKPRNPVDSYTVIATINDYDTGKLLALATGTQANLRTHPDDIEDCHAESLVKRAFKRYLIDKELPENLTFFVSQFPCGLIRRYEGEEPVDETSGAPIRRKPGRGAVKDGRTMYVDKDNCATKMRCWVSKGLQGNKLKQMLGVNSSIKQIVVADCETPENFDYESQLEQLRLFLSDSSIRLDVAKHTRRDEFVFNSAKQPQPVSLVWWAKDPDTLRTTLSKRRKPHEDNLELIVDGRKRGLTQKQCLSDRGSCKLKVADHCLRRDLEFIKRSLCT